MGVGWRLHGFLSLCEWGGGLHGILTGLCGWGGGLHGILTVCVGGVEGCMES